MENEKEVLDVDVIYDKLVAEKGKQYADGWLNGFFFLLNKVNKLEGVNISVKEGE